jgi:hypothetical protein
MRQLTANWSAGFGEIFSIPLKKSNSSCYPFKEIGSWPGEDQPLAWEQFESPFSESLLSLCFCQFSRIIDQEIGRKFSQKLSWSRSFSLTPKYCGLDSAHGLPWDAQDANSSVATDMRFKLSIFLRKFCSQKVENL